MLTRIASRLALTFAVLVCAATLNFFLPRLSGKDPVSERLTALIQGGQQMSVESIRALQASYNERFGLDRPLWEQYLTYLWDVLRFDFGYSLQNFPTRVWDMIAFAMPWTIGLMVTATLIAFVLGSILGALAASRRGRVARMLMPPAIVVAALPFFLVGLILIYLLATRAGLFPSGGGHSSGRVPRWDLVFALDVLRHAFLPALSIVIASLGNWALGMRAMMITVRGEDYMTFAEARGLSERRMFYNYGVRNSILPQVTTLALSLGQVVTGAVLVEIIFAYPGLGNLLLQAVQTSDFFVIYGIVMILVLTVALATLLLDLLYPLIDPRARR